MAIIDCVPGLEVSIKVNGAVSAEYDDPHVSEDAGPSNGKVVTKYIESVDNAEFSVLTSVGSEYDWGDNGHNVVGYVYLDGKRTRATRVRWNGRHRTSELRGVSEQSCKEGEWVLRKFSFSPIQIVEDGRAARSVIDKKAIADMGVIQVVVSRMLETPSTEQGDSRGYASAFQSSLEASEKVVKGRSVSHGTSLTKTEPHHRPRYVHRVPLPGHESPIATFRFLYRSKDALRSELIIGRSPSPDPLDGLSNEELRRLARERLSNTTKPEVKSETSIKRERAATIDLTGDGPTPSNLKKTRYESPIDLSDD